MCYWILPYLFDALKGTEGSIVLVVSPLIVLMKDQVQALHERGVSAVCLRDADPDSKKIWEIHEGKFQILFSSPEELLTNYQWREMLSSSLYKQNLVAIVVDEAHCVIKW